MQHWGKIRDVAKYTGLRERTIRKWLKAGLRHSRIPGGCVLVKFQDVDEFLKSYEVQENEIDRIVDEVMNN
jgi:excisionase family DNA binding protein